MISFAFLDLMSDVSDADLIRLNEMLYELNPLSQKIDTTVLNTVCSNPRLLIVRKTRNLHHE